MANGSGYGEKLKDADTETSEKVIDKNKAKKRGRKVGSTTKKAGEARTESLTISLSAKEKKYLLEQATNLTKSMNVTVSASAFIRMKGLVDMPEDYE